MIRSSLIGACLVLLASLSAAQDVPEDELTQEVPFHLPRTRWSEHW